MKRAAAEQQVGRLRHARGSRLRDRALHVPGEALRRDLLELFGLAQQRVQCRGHVARHRGLVQRGGEERARRPVIAVQPLAITHQQQSGEVARLFLQQRLQRVCLAHRIARQAAGLRQRQPRPRDGGRRFRNQALEPRPRAGAITLAQRFHPLAGKLVRRGG